jgi:ankyrin repeat protein
MSTPHPQRRLPDRPDLDHLRHQARNLRRTADAGDKAALGRVLLHLPDRRRDDPTYAVTLGAAQLAIAREYGFPSWRALKRHVDSVTAAAPGYAVDDVARFFDAIGGRNADAARRCLEQCPALVEARILDTHRNLRGGALAHALSQHPHPLPDQERATMALHLVAVGYRDQEASLATFRLLLDHGADVDALGFEENNGRCTPIVLATWEGGVDIMRLLLEHGADVSGNMGVCALETAANHAADDRYDLLAEFGAPSTPWMLVSCGRADQVLQAVDADLALLTRRDSRGLTLLQAAADRMNRNAGPGLPKAGRAIAEALLERGADVDIFTAVALDDAGYVGEMLRADPAAANARLGDGRGPVDFAVAAGSTASLAALLAAGADPNHGEPLCIAARLDDSDACRCLLAHGATVTDEVVCAAAWKTRECDCLMQVLSHGGNPKAIIGGWGAVHWASRASTDDLRLLIEAGADVDMPSPARAGDRPLHFAAGDAVRIGGKERPDLCLEITRTLLAAGADPRKTNENSETPLDVALRSERQDLVALLREEMFSTPEV